MPYSDVKIFGERHTSTNALKLLIERNSDSRVLPSVSSEVDRLHTLRQRAASFPFRDRRRREAAIDRSFRDCGPLHAWKHALTHFPAEPFRNTLVVITVRHPVSWAIALKRRPANALMPVSPYLNLSGFVMRNWETVRREGMKGVSVPPPALYDEKLRANLAFAERVNSAGGTCLIVRFEDFAEDQTAVFERLRPHLSNPVTAPSTVLESTKERGKNADYYRLKYGKSCGWLSEDMGIGDFVMVDNHFDWSLPRLLGYPPTCEMVGLPPTGQFSYVHSSASNTQAVSA